MRTVYQQTKQLLQEKENNVQQLRREIAEMEEAQAAHHAAHLAGQLASGEPCPVCGSTEHPSPAQDNNASPIIWDAETKENDARRCPACIWWSTEKKYVEAKSNGQAIRQVTDELYRNITGEASYDQDKTGWVETRYTNEKGSKQLAPFVLSRQSASSWNRREQTLEQLKQTFEQEQKARRRAPKRSAYTRRNVYSSWSGNKLSTQTAAWSASGSFWVGASNQARRSCNLKLQLTNGKHYSTNSRKSQEADSKLQLLWNQLQNSQQIWSKILLPRGKNFLAKLGRSRIFWYRSLSRKASGSELEERKLQEELEQHEQQRRGVSEQIESLLKRTDKKEKARFKSVWASSDRSRESIRSKK